MPINEIKIQQWVGKGIMTRTDALDWDHPLHPYNQAKAQGVRPEDFGIKNPLAEEFKSHSRDDLIEEVLRLRELIKMEVIV